MKPTWFTVTGDFRAVVADTVTDTDHDPDLIPITATVTFTPVLANGDLILATKADPRPTGYLAAPIVAIIDPVDGRLKMRPSSDDGVAEFTPVRLLADSPLLELKTPLFYRVTFSNVRMGGKPSTINPFTFQAPNADGVELNLITVMRQPGQPPSGITKIAPGAVRLLDDGRVQFSFAGVDIPEPLDLAILGGGGVGLQGPKGDKGDPGEPGKDGSAWLFGDGPPGTLLGSKPGDVYLDRLTGLIYQLGDSPIK